MNLSGADYRWVVEAELFGGIVVEASRMGEEKLINCLHVMLACLM